jgi:cell filamentation protein
MGGPTRYDVSDQEAGIEGGILKNRLGLKTQQELDDAESILLSDAYDHYFALLEKGGLDFGLGLVIDLHRYFLGELYDWAGKPRTVDISKDGMLFAPVAHLASSIMGLEAVFSENLPADKDSMRQVAGKLATIHNEFNAVHPFREGNGRTIRLFLDLLAASRGLKPIDWSVDSYFEACRAGMAQEHGPMADVIFASIGEGQ